jgi:hypothetical protein
VSTTPEARKNSVASPSCQRSERSSNLVIVPRGQKGVSTPKIIRKPRHHARGQKNFLTSSLCPEAKKGCPLL